MASTMSGEGATYRYGGIFPCVKPTANPVESTPAFTYDTKTTYEAGLREGRLLTLKWVADGLEKLAPILVKGGWPAKTLLDGFASQIQKYLRTGDLPGTGDDE
jgi:hypothetical protein